MTPAVEVRTSDGVAHLTLSRPERGNALGPDLVEAALEAVHRTLADGARMIVLRGAGKHFCTGFDLSDLAELSDGDLLLRVIRIETLLQAVHHAPVPTIAVAHGATMGAGADLVAACQMRWALPGTRFAFPGAGFGLALGTRRLAFRIGSEAARDLVGSGRRIDASEAASLGLIQRMVDPDALESEMVAASRHYALDAATAERVHALTVPDTRESDLANLAMSAARPGLKARITSYVASLQDRKAEGGKR
ncbi:enoyl-CoA hydratase/isomerase family protein [Thalassobaculum sp.]|uniref:enoyl-CoA hydratase/isomerase family protein n=1 Tax=Thalassobaculum sp. TaxID=2022740 RepID=UPI0032ECF439